MATVSAWMPYDAQNDVDISDQSAGFAQFDYLAATAEGQSYTAPVSMQFTHKMAKVRCLLKPGKGVTEADLNAASVKFAGYTSATFTEGSLTGSGYGWIIPASDREALLVSQNMTGKDFITIEMGGNEYVYTPADDNAGLLKEGLLHQYTITVNAGGIEVSTATGGEWTDGGSEDVPSVNIVESFTAEQVKIGDYVYTDGTFSDGGLRYHLADGTFVVVNATPVPDKTPIGVVFHLRNESSPKDECEYTEFGNQSPSGYIVSVVQNRTAFMNSMPRKSDLTPNGTINGYKYTQIYYEKYHEQYQLFAINWCKGISTISSSDGYDFTPWYMPSQQEYIIMRGESNGKTPVLDIVDKNVVKVSGIAFANGFYSTCGLMGNYGNYLHVFNLKTGNADAGWGINSVTNSFYYRAVCAFRTK